MNEAFFATSWKFTNRNTQILTLLDEGNQKYLPTIIQELTQLYVN